MMVTDKNIWERQSVTLHLCGNQSSWSSQLLVLCRSSASASVSSIRLTDGRNRKKYHKKNLRNAPFVVQQLLFKTEVSSVMQMLTLCGFAKKV